MVGVAGEAAANGFPNLRGIVWSGGSEEGNGEVERGREEKRGGERRREVERKDGEER